MSFGVFMHRTDSIYDDVPAESYQFPPQYLGRVQACVGDWIIYLEPSKVPHTRGYFAVAKVRQVISDPSAPNMYRAIIEPYFCGCRSVCKDFLIFVTCNRVRSFVRPVHAADKAPLAGMVMRGPGPHLQQRAQGSEKVSGLPNPDRFDHLSIRIMPSSQLSGPIATARPFRRRSAPDRDRFRRA